VIDIARRDLISIISSPAGFAAVSEDRRIGARIFIGAAGPSEIEVVGSDSPEISRCLVRGIDKAISGDPAIDVRSGHTDSSNGIARV
jgi:hypothetical protein